MTDLVSHLAGRRGWIISDGKTGNDVQTRGVFEAMGLDITVKHIDPKGLWYGLSPWIGVAPSVRFGQPGSDFAPPWPDFAISVGRLTFPYIRRLKRAAKGQTFTIVLQDPKTPARDADVYWVPQHDKRRGDNVIVTLTAPHGFSARRLAGLRQTMPAEIAALPTPRVAVLLGGPNGDFDYTDASLARLGSALASLSALGASLMITPSRRTPANVTQAVDAATRGLTRWFWDGTGENPYGAFLAHADAFIVPADSVNMCGEPCVTGKPVYVFEPEGGSPKFARFHEALAARGATRPLPAHFASLETWSYPPMSSAEEIAQDVARRWLARQR